jgi:hypothetical protein
MGQRHDGAPFRCGPGRMNSRRWSFGTCFGTCARLGFLGSDEWRMGEGLAGNLRRCAFPMTEFFETPSTVPMCEVLWPAVHSRFRSAIFASVQANLAPPVIGLELGKFESGTTHALAIIQDFSIY